MDWLNLENFVWLQVALALFGVAYLVRRRSRPPSRLRWGRAPEREIPEEMSRPSEFWQPHSSRDSVTTREPPRPGERELNVHFNFNGHSWDAYETLGLPAGSSMDRVEEAFRQALRNADPSSHEFFNHAVEAIRKQRAS